MHQQEIHVIADRETERDKIDIEDKWRAVTERQKE